MRPGSSRNRDDAGSSAVDEIAIRIELRIVDGTDASAVEAHQAAAIRDVLHWLDDDTERACRHGHRDGARMGEAA